MRGFENVDAAAPAENVLSEAAAVAEQEDGTLVAPRRSGGSIKKRKWTSQSFLALFLALLPMIGFLLFSTAPLVISLIAL